MSTYLKEGGAWTGLTQQYKKVSGVWQQISDSDMSAYLADKVTYYYGEAPQIKYVKNLLPQFTQSYWDITNLTVNSWSGTESGAPGNVIRVTTQAVNEGFFKTKSGYYPTLHVGHTYYLRWYYHKTGQYTGSITFESFWPEKANPIVPRFYGTAESWQMTSYLMTLNASQWTTTTTDGDYVFRFDVNSDKKVGCVVRFAGAILIDVTEDYTNQGITAPSKAELDQKSYFYGQRDITGW